MGSSLQLQDLGRSLNELWKLMQTPLEEQQQFEHISCNIEVIEEDIMVPGSLVLDIIDR
jgi:protein regulator of cytokinesis 1